MPFLLQVLRCFGPLLRCAYVEGEDSHEATRKSLLVPAALVAGVGYLLAAITFLAAGRVEGTLSPTITGVICIGGLANILVTRSLSQRKAGVLVIAVYLSGSVISDILSYALHENYTTAVVAMDALLLCNCDRTYPSLLRVVAVVHIVVVTLEETVGLIGLFDVVPEEWSNYKRPDPLGSGFIYPLLSQRLGVFVIDFAMTQYFAYSMREKQAAVEASISAARKIAEALARFDTDEASGLIQREADLPTDLHQAFNTLVGNLRTYRPYLPHSCLPDEVRTSESEELLEEFYTHSASPTSLSSTTSKTVAMGAKQEHRSISLVALNIVGFLGLQGWAQGFLDPFLNHVTSIAKKCHGLTESFDGDRVLVSFNAARTCTSYHRRAMDFAMLVTAVPALQGQAVSWSSAVTSGCVAYGAMGCEGLMRFTLVGTLVPWVHTLERYAKHTGLAVVADSSIVLRLELVYHFRLVDSVLYEKHTRPTRVFTPTGEISENSTDWLYQLSSARNTWESYNRVKAGLLQGVVDREELLKLKRSTAPESQQLHTFASSYIGSGTDIQGFRGLKDIGLQDTALPSYIIR